MARTEVTEISAATSPDHAPLVAALAEAGAPAAILGFGISTPDQVGRALSSGAAGVICGSAIVRLAAESADPAAAVALFIATMRRPKEFVTINKKAARPRKKAPRKSLRGTT